MMVSYDPSANAAGVALWENGELCSGFLARGKGWLDVAKVAVILLAHKAPPGMIQEIAIEIPQVYVQSRLRGDPNDLITVAQNAAAFVTLLSDIGSGPDVYEYRPRDWKGQTPKPVSVRRTQSKLSIEELSRIDQATPKTLLHNVYDAVGIGLHHLKRK